MMPMISQKDYETSELGSDSSKQAYILSRGAE